MFMAISKVMFNCIAGTNHYDASDLVDDLELNELRKVYVYDINDIKYIALKDSRYRNVVDEIIHFSDYYGV